MSNLDKEFGGDQDGADEAFKHSRQRHNESLALEREKWQRERDQHEIRCIVLNAARMDLLHARGAEEIAAQANYVADLGRADDHTRRIEALDKQVAALQSRSARESIDHMRFK